MKYFWIIITVLSISILPSLGLSETVKISMAQQKKATIIAQKALADLILLAQQVDPESLGFEDEKQIRAAKVGVPISDYFVRLDELREYQPGKPAKEMLHATGRLIFPLEVDQRARSMAVLSLKQDDWTIESFGGTNQIQMITELRNRIAKSEERSMREFFQVRIPALKLMFVGMERGSELYLLPLFDMPHYGLKEGKTYPAEKVLEKLVEAAQKHNGLPT